MKFNLINLISLLRANYIICDSIINIYNVLHGITLNNYSLNTSKYYKVLESQINNIWVACHNFTPFKIILFSDLFSL